MQVCYITSESFALLITTDNNTSYQRTHSTNMLVYQYIFHTGNSSNRLPAYSSKLPKDDTGRLKRRDRQKRGKKKKTYTLLGFLDRVECAFYSKGFERPFVLASTNTFRSSKLVYFLKFNFRKN